MKKLITILAILLIIGCTTNSPTETGSNGVPDDFFPWDTTCYMTGRLKTEVVFYERVNTVFVKVKILPDGYDTLDMRMYTIPIIEVNQYELYPREFCK